MTAETPPTVVDPLMIRAIALREANRATPAARTLAEILDTAQVFEAYLHGETA